MYLRNLRVFPLLFYTFIRKMGTSEHEDFITEGTFWSFDIPKIYLTLNNSLLCEVEQGSEIHIQYGFSPCC